MIIHVTREDAQARKHPFITPTGEGGFVQTYVGVNRLERKLRGESDAPPPTGPMANLVQQAPSTTVPPHYHGVDQFQIFVAGSGRIGTHTLTPIRVHFAGPWSPYGPIVAGPEGVDYLTLRPRWDPGAQWMPAMAPQLRAIPDRKQVSFTSDPLTLCQDTSVLSEHSMAVVLTEEAGNGSSACLRRAGPGHTLPADATGSAGAFWYVVAGSLDLPDRPLGTGSLLYFDGAEAPGTYRAGPQGVELLHIQFPQRP